MVNVKFDGNKEAERMVEFLEENERCLGKSLVIFQCDPTSREATRGEWPRESTYVRLKREMGERLGVITMVYGTGDMVHGVEDLKKRIKESNEDEAVDGILVQLPIFNLKELKNSRTPRGDTRDRQELEILSLIKPSKDVDGLNPKSKFVPAVVRATERVMEIFKVDKDSHFAEASRDRQKIALVGSKGMVGKRMGERLKVLGFDFTGFDKGDDLNSLKDFEVIITATGVADLITAEMVKEGFVGIDLGFPKAEFANEAAEKALLITPVPGGIGPMTIASLFENLAEV